MTNAKRLAVWLERGTGSDAEKRRQARRVAAQLRADGERIKALEAGIQAFLDGDYERPVGKEWRSDGKPSKHDRCLHDVWMYEYCEACADLHLEHVLKDPGND